MGVSGDKKDKKSKGNPEASRQPTKHKQDQVHDQDLFYRQRVYPDAAEIFSQGGKTPVEMLAHCIVVPDTNALLVPYNAGGPSLKAIDKVFKKAAKGERLVVPGQVAREFAPLRAKKLGELVQQLQKMNEGAPAYPLLEDSEDHKALVRIAKERRQHIENLIAEVKGWAWNDPVSKVYAETLTECVFDPDIGKTSVLERVQFNKANSMLPGYKDEGIGDVVIWLTLLEIGKARQQDLLFVTGDDKADWWHRGSGQALYPRFELVDEYRRASGGRTFAMCSLADLLNLEQVPADVVEQVRKTEEAQLRLLVNERLQEGVHPRGQVQRSPTQHKLSELRHVLREYAELTPEQEQAVMRALGDTELQRVLADTKFQRSLLRSALRSLDRRLDPEKPGSGNA